MMDQWRTRASAASSSGKGPLKMKWLLPCTKMPTIPLQASGRGCAAYLTGVGRMPRDMAGVHGLIVRDRREWMGGSVSPWESRDREITSQECDFFPETAKRWATLF